MKLYVAGKWEEAERVREVMWALVDAGHTITFDWTRNEQMSEAAAESDWDGVMKADALVLVVEKDLPYKGAMAEFGMAVARRIPIYVIGSHNDSNIFMRLPFVRKGYGDLFAYSKGLGGPPVWNPTNHDPFKQTRYDRDRDNPFFDKGQQ